MQTECSADLFGFARVEGRAVVAAFDGGKITSDAGVVLLGATDRAIGLVDRFAACFSDCRVRELVEHAVPTLVGQRVFGIALGYEDLVDHDELRHDPVMAVLAGKLAARRSDCAPLAGKSTLNRLELSRPEPTRYHKISYDGAAIEELFVDLFLEAHSQTPQQITLDLDATDDPLHGHQEGRFFHGYYDCYCYLPLYVFCGQHLLAAKLRTANIDGSAGAIAEMARIVAQIRERWPTVRILLRGDSGFAREALMAWCENNAIDYLFGLARTTRLVAEIEAELATAAELSQKSGTRARRFKSLPPRRRGTPPGQRTTAGAASAGWLPRPNGPVARPIPGSLSPLSHARSTRAGISTRSSISPAASWRTALRSASSTSSPTALRRARCVPTSCGCGSLRWPMCWFARCVASPSCTPSSPAPLAAPSASSCSRSAPWCEPAYGASNSPCLRPSPIRPSTAPPTPRSSRAATDPGKG